MESDEDDQQFAKQGGEALNLGDDFDSEEEGDEEEEDDEQQMQVLQQQQKAQQLKQQQQKLAQQKQQQQPQSQKPTGGSPGKGSKQGSPDKDIKGKQVENQPFDLAVEVNDSEELESDEDEEEVNVGGMGGPGGPPAQPKTQSAASAQQQQQQTKPQGKPQQLQKKKQEEDEDDDDKEVPGAYNPMEFANLQVSQEVKDLFEYIQRYKPQKIDLDTKVKPFIPDYIPAVGEVDSFLKMPKPDGNKEDLGITVLDEPSLNHEDKTVLELKYIQSKNVVRSTPMTVESIEYAEKKPKEISRWINSVQDLHKTRPPPTVNYTKQMPDQDALMEEWPRSMENALREVPFPGPEIDMHTADYARLVCAMLDIPSYKLSNNKSVIESLHVLFSLYSDFKQNQHFNQNQNQGFEGGEITQF